MAGMACIPNIDIYRSLFVKTDYLTGLDYLKRGCELSDSESCYMVGGLLFGGVPPLIQQDSKAAYHYDVKV